VLGYYASSVAIVVLVWLVLHRVEARRVLLAWPLMVMAGMVVASWLAPTAAGLCLGSLTVCFLFSGLTQPSGSSLLLFAPAVASFYLTNDLPLSQATVKIPIDTVVWFAVSELPAWLYSRLRIARADLERLASTDPLTGLANRRSWDARLTELLDRQPGATAVLLMDLDHFKQFNDAHGHLTGDDLLVDFGRAIERAVPEGDIAARWGGEEFAVALSDASKAEAVAQQIRGDVPLGQTVSIGLVVHQEGESVLELMRRADGALYQAKDQGRDCVVAA
jgi:diguanylate cyclase (GGDEF)-like protein